MNSVNRIFITQAHQDYHTTSTQTYNIMIVPVKSNYQPCYFTSCITYDENDAAKQNLI